MLVKKKKTKTPAKISNPLGKWRVGAEAGSELSWYLAGCAQRTVLVSNIPIGAEYVCKLFVQS
jgi:hypothetical protein